MALQAKRPEVVDCTTSAISDWHDVVFSQVDRRTTPHATPAITLHGTSLRRRREVRVVLQPHELRLADAQTLGLAFALKPPPLSASGVTAELAVPSLGAILDEQLTAAFASGNAVVPAWLVLNHLCPPFP